MNRTDRATRDALVVENLPLVGYLVSEVCSRATHLSRDDLASVGAVALVQAAEAFDPTLGIPFGAYARTRVVGAFADDMRSGDWASRGTRKRIKETLAVQEALSASLGRAPSVDEIAGALGVDRQTATAALTDAARTVSSLDDTVADHLVADVPLPGEQLLAARSPRSPTSSASPTAPSRSSAPRPSACCATPWRRTTPTTRRPSSCRSRRPRRRAAAPTCRASRPTPPSASPAPCASPPRRASAPPCRRPQKTSGGR
jgi:hypothetical protein